MKLTMTMTTKNQVMVYLGLTGGSILTCCFFFTLLTNWPGLQSNRPDNETIEIHVNKKISGSNTQLKKFSKFGYHEIFVLEGTVTRVTTCSIYGCISSPIIDGYGEIMATRVNLTIEFEGQGDWKVGVRYGSNNRARKWLEENN